MKHFVDIERLREKDEQIGDAIKPRNDTNFHIGDHIVIQHKIDGANGSFKWEDGEVKAFSRKNELTPEKTNQGFYMFVQQFPEMLVKYIKDNPNFIFFGEWEVKHTIVYRPEVYHKFYLYDVYDTNDDYYLSRHRVQLIASYIHAMFPNIEYIATYYNGEFKGWDHARTFLHENTYGNKQEGIVIKNQNYLKANYVESSSAPTYIKIVNDEFKEVQTANHIKKVLDPNYEKAKADAMAYMGSIVTEPRVRKELNKAIDEGLIPSTLTPRDMGNIIKTVVPNVYKDCVKEEPETVQAAGEYAGKACSKIAIDILKKLIIG